MSRGGYYLPACVVLLAAIHGTRQAFEAAMAMLPAARRVSERWVAAGGRRPALELISGAQETEDEGGEDVLAWARKRAMAGRGLPGASRARVESAPVSRKIRRPGRAVHMEDQRRQMLVILRLKPMAPRKLATVTGWSAPTVCRRLRELASAGAVVPAGLDGRGAHKSTIWRAAV
jgi:hypothetical protein